MVSLKLCQFDTNILLPGIFRVSEHCPACSAGLSTHGHRELASGLLAGTFKASILAEFPFVTSSPLSILVAALTFGAEIMASALMASQISLEEKAALKGAGALASRSCGLRILKTNTPQMSSRVLPISTTLTSIVRTPLSEY